MGACASPEKNYALKVELFPSRNDRHHSGMHSAQCALWCINALGHQYRKLPPTNLHPSRTFEKYCLYQSPESVVKLLATDLAS